MYNTNDWMLFKQALTEGTVRKYNKELSRCDTDDTVSERYRKAMKRIIKNAGKQSTAARGKGTVKKRVIAVLIAAALLLAGGLTVYAKRDAIVRFVTQIFDGYTKGSYREEPGNEDAAPEVIEQEYMPSYVPKGYELANHIFDDTLNRIEWLNADEEYLIFSQNLIGANYAMDNEHSTFEIKDIGEYSVHILKHENAGSIYLWTDEKYSYSIRCTDNLPQDEISRMILSVSEKK